MVHPHRLSMLLGAGVLAFGGVFPLVARADAAPDETADTVPSTTTTTATTRPRSSSVRATEPRWRGNTLFVTGAATAAVSLGLHALAARTIQKKCRVVENPSDLLPSSVRALGIGDVLDSSFLANIDVICSPTVALAGAARLLVPVFSAGAIAQIAVGGAFSGDHEAFEDTFANGRRGKAALTIGLGSVALAGGVALWVGSRASMYENHTGCNTIGCLAWYDFGTVQGSALLTMTGAGMLAHGVAYRRGRRHYSRLKDVEVSPVVTRNQAGLAITGRF